LIIRYHTKVSLFREKRFKLSVPIFYCSFILAGTGSGKISVYVQTSCNSNLVGKAFVVVKGNSMQGIPHIAKPFDKSLNNYISVSVPKFVQSCMQGCSVGHDQ
jgi:hypothetical protein